jgi:SAM-dependent methyltransferase
MKNADKWSPTKFVLTASGWQGSDDSKELSPGSRLTASRAVELYSDAIAQFASGHLLDLGCGQAPLYGAYKEFVAAVTCIDWPGSLHRTSHVDVFADLNMQLPIASEQFDTILSTSVLEHIWQHQLLWSEMARVLKPGGHLILGTPFLYAVHEAPHDYFRWTPFALRQACLEVELHVVELKAYGGGLDVLADLTMKLALRKSPRTAALLGKLACSGLRKGFFRRLSDRTTDMMPLGHVIVAKKPECSLEAIDRIGRKRLLTEAD